MTPRSPTAAPGTTVAHAFAGDRAVTADLVREHNLNAVEYERILDLLGRTPTLTELGVFSALWSEHCSYKHSKPILQSFPTTGPQVVQGKPDVRRRQSRSLRRSTAVFWQDM